jgi:hypothetical protein
MSSDIRWKLTRGSDIDISNWPCGDGGAWRLNPRYRVLTHPDYEVDLDDCLTSAEVLDWIMQVAGKTWADDATLAGLVRALGDVLQPQARLCSWGKSTRISKTNVAELVTQAARRWPGRTVGRQTA